MRELKRVLAATPQKIDAAVSSAINKTLAASVSLVAKKITEEIATSQKNVKTGISTRKSNKKTLSATLTLRKTKRLGLEFFKPRQNASGVTAKISKKKKPTKVQGAFMGPRPGKTKSSWNGKAFIRKGNAKTPIQKLRGPSPWGVYVAGDTSRVTEKEIKDLLLSQVARKIRDIKFKQGTL